MVWLISLSSVLLVVLLACAFVRNARAIRRDLDERFKQVEAELEEEANSVVKDILNPREGT